MVTVVNDHGDIQVTFNLKLKKIYGVIFPSFQDLSHICGKYILPVAVSNSNQSITFIIKFYTLSVGANEACC